MTYFDVIGIGFGPGNISLAIALEESNSKLSTKFLESAPTSSWQKDMMIVDADIQHNPIMDLVTPRNPRSHYSFLNFLHSQDRLFEHFNMGLHFPLREEYSQYITWAASHFDDVVSYNSFVTNVDIIDDHSIHPSGSIYKVTTSNGDIFFARSLVIATGRTPRIIAPFDQLPVNRVIHASRYLSGLAELSGPIGSVAVIGGSQSAVEILLDITARYPDADIANYIRNFGYRQKDLSPQMEASIYPRYKKEHFDRNWDDRARFNNDIKYQNYSSADIDVLVELNKRNYISRMRRGSDLYRMFNNTEIVAAEYIDEKKLIEIKSRNIYTKEVSIDRFEHVILCTGYRDMGPGPDQEKIPDLLAHLADNFLFDEAGVVSVNFDYTLETKSKNSPLTILNGLCEGTHGVSDAGSFSLLALRSEVIADVLHREVVGHG
jgi:L-ornithine N5-oxygenase